MTSPTSDRRQGLVGNTPFKAPVDCATTANITLSGEQVIDGFQTASSRCLVKNQTDATKNGIYDTSSAGWTRSQDADGNYDLTTGTVVYVINGTVNGSRFFQVTTAKPITIGTTALNWALGFITSSDVFAQNLAFLPGTIGAKLKYDGISVRDAPYGAYGDAGVHDDTAAINAAIAAAIANQQSYVYLPPGNYRISAPLTVSGSVAIIGAGRNCTQISWTSTTMIGLNIATPAQVIVRGITFAAPLLCTAGGCIALNGTGGVANAFSQITDCVFSNGFAQLTTATAYAVKIRDNYFSGAVNSAITIQNTVNVDAGDSSIVDNEITNLGAAAIGIIQASSGGLKIHGNKIIGGTQGMALSLSAGAATSILLVSSNSIELSTAAAITLLFGAGSSFAIVDINDNELSQVPIGVNIPGSGATVALSNVNVSDNIASLTAAGTFGIIINNVSNFTCEGNTIIGNGGTPTGINVGGFSSQGRVGLNNYPGCTTKVANASGTTYVAPAWVQTGAQGVTCNTARGPVFFGSAATVFGVAFDAAPTVTCDPGTLANGLSAWASSVTKTGFTMNAIAATSASTGNCAYSATGLI